MSAAAIYATLALYETCATTALVLVTSHLLNRKG